MSLGQSTHRHCTPDLSPILIPHTHTTKCQLNYYRLSGWISWCTHHFTLHYVCSSKLVLPDFVYPMHFTHYSLQWHLLNFKMKYSWFLLNDSKCNEQWPRIQAHKYIYNVDVYTNVTMIHQLSIPYIRFEKSVLLPEIWIKLEMAVKRCHN